MTPEEAQALFTMVLGDEVTEQMRTLPMIEMIDLYVSLQERYGDGTGDEGRDAMRLTLLESMYEVRKSALFGSYVEMLIGEITEEEAEGLVTAIQSGVSTAAFSALAVKYPDIPGLSGPGGIIDVIGAREGGHGANERLKELMP